jgi:hypothetical protein
MKSEDAFSSFVAVKKFQAGTMTHEWLRLGGLTGPVSLPMLPPLSSSPSPLCLRRPSRPSVPLNATWHLLSGQPESGDQEQPAAVSRIVI